MHIDKPLDRRAIDILNGGIETTVQDYPGRRIGLGIPRSGPMDSLAFRIANILVGNDPGTEGLETTLMGCRLYFHASAIVAFAGAEAPISIDGKEVPMWQAVVVPSGSKVVIRSVKDKGFRVYMAVRGGFPDIPQYLGSKSTSMGLGGYQVRRISQNIGILSTFDDACLEGTCLDGWRSHFSRRLRIEIR